MENSHRFFSNPSCRYFPCHREPEPERFNCLFCFCPLYLLEDCGGDFQISNGIKDCTGCSRPHRPEGYDEILERLRQEAAKRRGGAKAP